MRSFNFNGKLTVEMNSGDRMTDEYIPEKKKGKFYCEVTNTTPQKVVTYVGITVADSIENYSRSNTMVYYLYDGTILDNNGKWIPYYKKNTNEIIGILIDTANTKLKFSFNGEEGKEIDISMWDNEKIHIICAKATSQPSTILRFNFGTEKLKYKPEGYIALNDIFYKYLIKENGNLYNASDSKYNYDKKTYDNITINNNISEMCLEYGMANLGLLYEDKNINGENFKPIEKFSNFKIIKMEEF